MAKVRFMMSDILATKLPRSSNSSIYSSLTEDMETQEHTPVKPSPSKLSSHTRPLSRRLFTKNKSVAFRTQKRSNSFRTRSMRIGGRIRTVLGELQTKVQAWTHDIRGNHKDKTPTCMTPNRRVRYILGRTPEQLYSPFGIETPPAHFQKYSSRDLLEYPFNAFHDWLTPSRQRPVRKQLKMDCKPNHS